MATKDISPLALRPREAAKALNVSLRTLWAWTQRGIVPCVKVGAGKRKAVLYPVRELQAWLSRQVAAAAPQAGDAEDAPNDH